MRELAPVRHAAAYIVETRGSYQGLRIKALQVIHMPSGETATCRPMYLGIYGLHSESRQADKALVISHKGNEDVHLDHAYSWCYT